MIGGDYVLREKTLGSVQSSGQVYRRKRVEVVGTPIRGGVTQAKALGDARLLAGVVEAGDPASITWAACQPGSDVSGSGASSLPVVGHCASW
jgi:hypothetical protein